MKSSHDRPLSTNRRGPRSAAGRAAVSLNHLKHGLTSAAIVLPSEDAAGWARFHEDVLARFEAEGPVEVALASRVAELLWRLRRVQRAEEQAVSVVQLHRDTLALGDRQFHPAPPPASPDASDASAPRQQERAGERNFYASELLALQTVSQYRETLPALLPDDRALNSIMRYEAHLSRLLKHALHQLKELRQQRRGNATPPGDD